MYAPLRDHLYAQTEHLLDAFPEDPDLPLTAVSVYGKNRSVNHAFACMTRAIELNPENLPLHGKLAAMHFANGEYDAAVTEWRRTGQDPCAEDDYAAALLSLGRFSDVVACTPGQATARRHVLTGRALVRLNRLGDAAAAFDRALAMDPNELDAHYELARVAARLKDTARATRHMTAYREGRATIDADRDSYARTREGGVLHDETETRIETCGTLLVTVCEEGLRRYRDAGNETGAHAFLDASLSFLDGARAEAPDHPALLRAHAGLLLLRGEVERATDLARRAVERDKSAASYAVLGDAFRAQGKRREAGLWYQRALDLDPSHAGLRRRLASLAEEAPR